MAPKRYIFAAIACALPGAAVAVPALQHAVVYDPAEVAWAFKPGSSAVSGAMTWKWGGKDWPCASVDLVPRSAYADEAFSGVYGTTESARIKPTKMRGYFRSQDPRFEHDKLTAQCDAQGSFSFKAIPAGTYYLTGTFSGSLSTSRMGTFKNVAQELVMHRVTVGESDNAQIDLRDR